MKKSILITALMAIAFSVNAQQVAMRQMVAERPIQQATAEEGSMEYGYCGDLYQYIGMGSATTYRVMIEIPASDAAKFEGANITKVNIGIGTISGTSAKVLILKQLTDNIAAYSQDVTVKGESWNEITLTTPYTIGNEGFFVGYEITGKAEDYPIGCDGQAGNTLGDYVGFKNGLSFQYMHISEQGFGNNCIKLTLSGNNLPKYDLALQVSPLKEYMHTNTEFNLNGAVKNSASKTVNSFDVTYQIDEQAPVTTTINSTVAPGKTTTFAIEGLKFEQDGKHNVSVTVANLDGNADESDSDNSYSQTVASLSNFVPRKVLLENFSTAQCGNCPRVHRWFKAITQDRNDVAWVVHHAGFYTDDFTVSDSEKYTWFYGGGGTYAPAVMLDRTNLSDQGSGANVPVFFPESETSVENLIDYCIAEQAIISVKLEDAYNKDTRELVVKVSGKAETELMRTPYIHIFLTEDGLIGTQSGAGTNYEHNHALRKVITSTWGDELKMTGNEYEVTYTYTLDNGWDPEKMSVIAFVSNNDDYDPNACQVLNTDYKQLGKDSAVKGINADSNNVWVAGKTVCIEGAYKNATVYTTDGRMVKSANGTSAINIDNAGIYIVVIDGVSHKVAVK